MNTGNASSIDITGHCYVEAVRKAGVQLNLFDSKGMVISAFSGLDGAYAISVMPGSYLLEAKYGSCLARHEIEIQDQRSACIDLYLGKQPEKRDRWDKASIISSLMSGVVIALAGILISYTIKTTEIATSKANMEAQLELERVRDKSQQRFQEGQITAQLVEHLLNEDPSRREIAVIVLKKSTPQDIYEQILTVLAKRDSSANVRLAAIEQLGNAKTPEAAKALVSITNDATRPESERELAGQSAQRVAISRVFTRGTIMYAASSSHSMALESRELGGGVFTYFWLRGLRGEADENSDGNISAIELGRYVSERVSTYSAKTGYRQSPVFQVEGESDPVLVGPGVEYPEVVGLVIGVSDYPKLRNLPSASTDARKVYDALRQGFPDADASKLRLLMGGVSHRTIRENLDALSKSTSEGSLLVVYFSGMATLTEGSAQIIASDSEGIGTNIDFSYLRDVLRSARASTKLVIFDGCYAGALLEGD